MNGRQFTLIFLLILPAGLIGVTVAEFASNPLSIFVLISVMIAGALYLLTYRETFG